MRVCVCVAVRSGRAPSTWNAGRLRLHLVCVLCMYTHARPECRTDRQREYNNVMVEKQINKTKLARVFCFYEPGRCVVSTRATFAIPLDSPLSAQIGFMRERCIVGVCTTSSARPSSRGDSFAQHRLSRSLSPSRRRRRRNNLETAGITMRRCASRRFGQQIIFAFLYPFSPPLQPCENRPPAYRGSLRLYVKCIRHFYRL